MADMMAVTINMMINMFGHLYEWAGNVPPEVEEYLALMQRDAKVAGYLICGFMFQTLTVLYCMLWHGFDFDGGNTFLIKLRNTVLPGVWICYIYARLFYWNHEYGLEAGPIILLSLLPLTIGLIFGMIPFIVKTIIGRSERFMEKNIEKGKRRSM